MADQAAVFKNFAGGWATDGKVGLPHSFAYSQSLDFRKSPSQLTLLPQPVKEGNGVVNDLIQNSVISAIGDIYSIGSSGNLYRRMAATGEYRVLANTGAGTYGIDTRPDQHAIYITGRKHVHWLDGTSTLIFHPQYFGPSTARYDNTANVGFNVNPFQFGSNQTTTLGTRIIEKQPSTRFFQTDIEPLYGIGVYIVNKGTGDWTFTIHDGNNTVLATQTFTNANLTSGTFNIATFPAATNGQVRLYPAPNARTYHVHITSTVADGTVASSSNENMSTSDLLIYADRLVQTTNGIHPIERFQQYECIGNGNYLSIWEPISDPPTNQEWQRHKLVFPQEYEVCGLAAMNEFLAIACERSVTDANSNIVPDHGIIFFWDGLSDTYNYYVKIPEGVPHAIHEHQNVVYYYAGGDWYGIASGSTTPVKIRNMPGSDGTYFGTNTYTKIYPYAATIRKGIHLMGYPSETNNTGINFGVYSYGQVDKNFPQSFGYNYQLSTGSVNYSAQNNLRIGMVKNYGDSLYISWRDDLNGNYGIDKVDSTSNPANSAEWQSIIFDNGMPSKLKLAKYMKISYGALPVGVTITPKYNINRSGWVLGDKAYSSTVLYNNRTDYCRLDIPEGEFTEIQVGFNVTATTTTPVISSVMLAFDDLRDQEE